ncbi:hypothetical protein J1N35_014571 [Gossypium stocksii]|uniref:Uncharacterized protein n=1 Tax=Gossypium stocksii TaxID=47602 RepID=A0A9D3VV22_9ROSI|nr:hypothetical protein J1N35_014571 [Gossypium stocksii]
MRPLPVKPILGKLGFEATGTFNLPYPKAGTIMEARRLSSRKRLFRLSKGDAPFGLTIVVIIKQPINNYNRCHTDPSLTSTSSKTYVLLLKVLLCPPLCQPLDKNERLKILSARN